MGENSPEIRAAACEGLSFLGVEIDPTRNAENRPDTQISSDDSRVRVLIIRTREDLEMLRELGPWIARREESNYAVPSEESA